LNVVVESSSHPSGLHSLFAQPYVYSGGGLGNFDECPLQNCLVASGQTTDSFTYASICLVPECSAYDVAAEDFTSVAARQLIQPHDYDDDNGNDDNDDDSLVESQRLGHDYVQLLQTIATINIFLGGGWTCGNFVVPWTYVNSGFCAVLFICLVGLPLFRWWRSRRQRRQRCKRQCRRRCHDHDPHHRTTTTPRTTTSTTTAREEQTTTTITSNHQHDSSATTTTNNAATTTRRSCSVGHGEVVFNTTTSSTYCQNGADTDQRGPMVPAKEADDENDDDDDVDRLLHQPALLFPVIVAAVPATKIDNHDDNDDDDWTAVWDVSRHLQSLLAPSQIPCIDGLRVGSMVWIILGM
jgi:hypothetical protein